jgi:N-methylhydantoinase B
MALASFFEPDLPRNEGTFRHVEIRLPEGSIVNPRPPAPMTMNTVFVAHEIVHVMWKALGQALPERARPAGRRRCTRSPPACSPTAAAT